MQLKTIGESLNEANAIKEVLSKYSSNISEGKNQYLIIQELKKATKDYTTEATKRAIIETTLNEKQINQILSSKGLKGEILETTTAELANITATNSLTVAESGMTTVTVSLKNAFKGLWATIGGFVAAHPILAITAGIGAGIAAFIKISDVIITTYNEASEKLDNCRNKLNDASSDVENAKSKLDSINESIKEIQDKGTLSLTDQEDLDRLKKEKEELERTLEIYKEKERYAKKDTEDSAVKKLTGSKYTSKNDMYSYKTDENGDIKQTNLGLVTYDSVIAYYQALKTQYEEQQKYLDWINENHPDWSGTVIDRVKNSLSVTKEEMANILVDINDSSDSLYGVTDNGKKLKNTISDMNLEFEIFRYKIGETSFDDLTNSAKKLVAAFRLEDNNSKNQIMDYLNSLSDEDFSLLVKSNVTFDENTTLESLKETIKAAQEEADKENVEVPLDLTSQLTESDNKSKEATLADLQSEADLLKTVKKEISENGRVGVSSLQKIIKEFPEAKEAVSEYMAGLISQEELFQKLEDVYNTDAEQYKKSATEKVKASSEFWNKMIEGNSYLQDALNDFYGDDYKNWTNLETAKAQSEKKLISQLGSLWAKYYENQLAAFMLIKNADGTVSVEDNTNNFQRKTVGNKLSGFNTLPGSNIDKVKEAGEKQTEADRAKLASLQKYIDAYNKAIKAMNDAANIPIDFDYTDWNALSGDDSSSSSSKETAEKLNWIERLINKISTTYSRLKNVVSDTTTTWLNRNNALADSMSTLRDEINAQSDAYEYYMNAFNSYGLDDYYKNQIADGSISIDVIYDDDLKNAISDCQDFYDKAQDAKTAVQELNIELKGLAKSRFDNVASEFEKQISYFKDYSDQLQKEMDIITTKGWFSSTFINESMKKVEQDNLDRLKQERDSLMSALNSAVGSGKIEKYSEDWYDMQSSLDSVTSSILDAEKALIEYDNAIRQIKWDAFDRTRDDIENLISETEFLVELLKDKGITDDDGNTTSEGKAAQALLVQKYQLYLNQAQKYKDEILKIDEELANNPYDKELLDRKQDLIDKQQEAIKSSISEKDAIKDLVNDGYNDLLDALQKVIDKQKERLSAEKSLHDYQRTVAEQTATIAQLQKRLLALQGDNSESGQSQKQSISSELKDAQDQLQETEYEQYIEDQTKMLDDLATQAEEWINTRLDNLDGLIQQIIDDSNTHSGDIKDTITNTANEFGVNLSEGMKSIWETNTNNINNNITSVFNDFGTKFDNTMTTLNNVVSGIEDKVQEMLRLANEEAAQRQAELEEQRRQQEAAESSSSSSDYSESDYDWDDIGGGDSGGDGVDWIYSPDYFPKDQLNVNTSIVDRLKSLDYDSSFGARAMYFEQMGLGNDYTGSYDDNVAMLDWMKSHGYRKGTKSATSGLHIYGEDDPGSELLVTKYGVLRQFDSGDTVFNKDQVEKLWNLSKGITTPNMYIDNLGAKLPDITPVSSSKLVDIGGINVNVDKVVTDNPEDFTRQLTNELAGNSKIQKILGEINSNQLLGRNSLSTRRYMK